MLKDFFIRNYVAIFNSRLARRALKPLPVDFWLNQRAKLHRYSSKPDILRPSARVLSSKGENIDVPELQKLLKGMIIGTWTLEKNTIRLLWDHLKKDKPSLILECGSGVSSLVFSQFFKLHHPQGKLISFEQGLEEKKRVEKLLKKNDLSGFATILHTPLNDKGRYDFNKDEISEKIQDRKAEWLLVDGPSGPPGCRDNIIPFLKPFLSSTAKWWMDDSFRDGELAFLKEWEQGNNIHVNGIYPVGNGLSTGTIN